MRIDLVERDCVLWSLRVEDIVGAGQDELVNTARTRPRPVTMRASATADSVGSTGHGEGRARRLES